MKNTLGALAFSTAVLAFSQANATIVVTAGPNAPFVASATETFSSGQTVGSAPANDSFATYSGTGVIANGTTPLVSVQPGGSSGNYLAVLGGKTETITFNGGPVNSVGLLWGSIDTYNELLVLGAGNAVIGTVTGTQVAAADPNPVTFGSTTGYVTLSGFGTIYGIELESPNPTYPGSGNSFEVTNIATAVPEASTWAMMLLGFCSVGLLSYRTRNRRPAMRLV